MNAMHRSRIRNAFAAAQDYDRHARVQRVVARRLAKRIAALPLPPRPRILEVGCGTGFLTEALIEQGIDGEWLITDIAPAMVERCRARIGEGDGRRFALLDGEYGDPGEGHFDLVCSSLVMQWFDDPPAALGRMLGWLAPGGHCLFSTLTAGSLAEWRMAHQCERLDYGTPRFPTAAQAGGWRQADRCGLELRTIRECHDSALDFLHALKAIGAGTASESHRPLPPADLRRVMRRFEQQGASVSYEVVIGHYRRSATQAG